MRRVALNLAGLVFFVFSFAVFDSIGYKWLAFCAGIFLFTIASAIEKPRETFSAAPEMKSRLARSVIVAALICCAAWVFLNFVYAGSPISLVKEDAQGVKWTLYGRSRGVEYGEPLTLAIHAYPSGREVDLEFSIHGADGERYRSFRKGDEPLTPGFVIKDQEGSTFENGIFTYG
ncbi:hypothetical protein ACFL1X_13965 [Candidatus Hydrogenedentota bacterium]